MAAGNGISIFDDTVDLSPRVEAGYGGPPLSRWGERLRERTLPLQPDDHLYGWVHAILCEALAQPYLQISELIDPPEPYAPWAPLFNIYICPGWALPWLAQLVGIKLPAGISDADARRAIKFSAGHNVGTVAAIRDALRTTLVPANPPTPATVYFRERDGSAYRLEVVTLDPETPDPAWTLEVLTAAIPGGLVLSYRSIEGWDYQAMTDMGGTYAEQSLQYATYADLRENKPSGPSPAVPRLDSVVPNTAQRLAVLTLNFIGNFPDDMLGYRAELTFPLELVPEVGFDIAKVSDSECNATGTMPHVGNEMVGTVRIIDTTGQPYTNPLDFTVTL
jgi:hypothetical protein